MIAAGVEKALQSLRHEGAVMQTEPRKRDLPRILVEGNAPTQRRPIVPVHGCGGEMFPAPVEGQLENFMELGDASFAADQEAPPNQGTDVPKNYSKLIKACHLRSLSDLARKLHNLSPWNLPFSNLGNIAMLGWRGAGITKCSGLRRVTRRRIEHHAVAVLGLNWLSQNWGPRNLISP